jgi:hypothetical protein
MKEQVSQKILEFFEMMMDHGTIIWFFWVLWVLWSVHRAVQVAHRGMVSLMVVSEMVRMQGWEASVAGHVNGGVAASERREMAGSGGGLSEAKRRADDGDGSGEVGWCWEELAP